MLPYYRKYQIIACIIAVVPALVATTAWPLATGQIMAASFAGLGAVLVIFFLSMMIGFKLMSGKADAETDALLSLYNDGCDPEALLAQGKTLAGAIAFPCKEAGAWFMGYYAQAALDAGDVDRARNISNGLRHSIDVAKTQAEKAGVLVNLVPLAEKMEPAQDVLALIDEGLSYAAQDPAPTAAQRRDFLESQKRMVQTRTAGDARAQADMDAAVRGSNAYPERIRVEAAFDEARACFKLGEKMQERACLEYVVSKGNKLALTARAKEMLAAVA